MSAAPLQADATEIGAYYDALFRYADEGGFLSARAFDQHDGHKQAVVVEGIEINGDAQRVVKRLAAVATRVANLREPAVFAPPVATFTGPNKATTADIANGVALSVELDAAPKAGRERLESILRPATLVMASGGEWTDPDTGEVHDKLHVHWRLTEPTRAPEDHAKLREARRLAALLAGGDPTAAPLVHPLRMAGSWNLKTRPGRLARNIAVNDAAEIDLGDALDRLSEAVEAAGIAFQDRSGPRVSAEPQAALANVASALQAIPNRDVEWEQWNHLGMAAWRATGGSQDGLDAWTAWSARSSKHDAEACMKRWQHFGRSPPSKVGAGTIFYMAKTTGWQFPRATTTKSTTPRPANDDRAGDDDEAHEAGGQKPPARDVTGFELTEDGVAWAFAEKAQGHFVFDHTSQQWYRWADGRWSFDAKAGAFHQVRVFCRKLRDRNPDAPKTMAKINFVSNVERAARTDPRLAVSHADWDKDRWLLGVPGGVVDLRTGELRNGDPGLFIRRQTAVAPAPPGTPAPLWMAFLNQATKKDVDLQRFLQRLAGYLLTGDVSEEMLTFLYGPGGNGKGVFLGVILAVLADYAVSVPIEVFVANGRLNLEYYRARMVGARLVTASETEAGATWAESLIKELTGNEAPLSARDPYGKPFTFPPHFKLLLVGNHAPRLKGRTPAMERRLRIVPFTHAPESPDPDLKEKLRDEYPAVLRWMLDGCTAWQRERLGTSEVIQQATSAYFMQQDRYRRWLTERCDLGDTVSEAPGKLFSDFTAWSRDNGEQPLTSGEFREIVERTPGLRYATRKGKQWVRGIALKKEEPKPEAPGADDDAEDVAA